MAKSSKTVYGVGVNDSPDPTQRFERVNGKLKLLWICPFYRTWKEMLKRGYAETYKSKNPTYEGVSICKEWHKFSIFKVWMESQKWEGLQLDKDILVPGNKEYNPQTCVFVTSQTNCFILSKDAGRGDWPIGVIYHKQTGKFMAQLQGRVPRYLGLFSSPEEAHQTWLTEKAKLAKILADQQTDPRVAKALIERYTNYKGDSN